MIHILELQYLLQKIDSVLCDDNFNEKIRPNMKYDKDLDRLPIINNIRSIDDIKTKFSQANNNP